MQSIRKFSAILVITALLFLSAAALGYFLLKSPPPKHKVEGPNRLLRVAGYLHGIRESLRRHANTDFEDLDLAAAPPPQYLLQLLRTVSTVDDPHLVFNLRRVTSSNGDVRDTLYAILPDVSEEVCEEAKGPVGGWDYYNHVKTFAEIQAPFILAADNHTIVEDVAALPNDSWCIKPPDQRLYLVLTVTSRMKRQGSNDWR